MDHPRKARKNLTALALYIWISVCIGRIDIFISNFSGLHQLSAISWLSIYLCHCEFHLQMKSRLSWRQNIVECHNRHIKPAHHTHICRSISDHPWSHHHPRRCQHFGKNFVHERPWHQEDLRPHKMATTQDRSCRSSRRFGYPYRTNLRRPLDNLDLPLNSQIYQNCQIFHIILTCLYA